MSTTVLDALRNAEINLGENGHTVVGRIIGMDQLKNAIKALENGLGARDVIQEHMFGEVNTGA